MTAPELSTQTDAVTARYGESMSDVSPDRQQSDLTARPPDDRIIAVSLARGATAAKDNDVAVLMSRRMLRLFEERCLGDRAMTHEHLARPMLTSEDDAASNISEAPGAQAPATDEPERWVNARVELLIPLDDVSVHSTVWAKQDAAGRAVDRVIEALPANMQEFVMSGSWEDATDAN
jgi:hypothetical protein